MDFLYALRSFDGFGYYLTAFVCVILIMAIIGYMMERSLKLLELAASKEVVTPPKDDPKTLPEAKEVESVPVDKIMKQEPPQVIDFTKPSTDSNTPQASVPEVVSTPVAPTSNQENSIPPVTDSTPKKM